MKSSVVDQSAFLQSFGCGNSQFVENDRQGPCSQSNRSTHSIRPTWVQVQDMDFFQVPYRMRENACQSCCPAQPKVFFLQHGVPYARRACFVTEALFLSRRPPGLCGF
ncbi:uncharacterized protein APUU_50902A [Aspergillus puulaauensis]|uniref:Uncharacterized protein n=1 Tax=Aspergillus puulaauensis TaxID=1220207 RepID=A0A7R7XR46_9EURO|nr:uncharacterized protein APUU_50902A [Aspergillus puulaauensis]BCS26191.1 hypothetical protein APUU_50902A [Aspergillus puulaauensis]